MMRIVLKISVSLVILAGLFLWVDTEKVLARLLGADWTWLVLSLAGLTLSTVSMARRWQLTAAKLRVDVSFRFAVREYYIAQLANSVLPGGVLGDVARALRLRQKADLKRAAQSVVAERLLGQVAMIGLLAAGFLGAFLWPGGVEWPWRVIGVVCGVAVVGGLGVYALCAVPALRSFADLMRVLMRDRELRLHAVIAGALLIFSLYACARAVGAIVPPEGWLTVLPLIFCAMLVPLSVAGWGWREGAAAAVFPFVGLSADAGVAMGICYGAMIILASLPALGFIVMRPDCEVESIPDGAPDSIPDAERVAP